MDASWVWSTLFTNKGAVIDSILDPILLTSSAWLKTAYFAIGNNLFTWILAGILLLVFMELIYLNEVKTTKRKRGGNLAVWVFTNKVLCFICALGALLMLGFLPIFVWTIGMMLILFGVQIAFYALEISIVCLGAAIIYYLIKSNMWVAEKYGSVETFAEERKRKKEEKDKERKEKAEELAEAKKEAKKGGYKFYVGERVRIKNGKLLTNVHEYEDQYKGKVVTIESIDDVENFNKDGEHLCDDEPGKKYQTYSLEEVRNCWPECNLLKLRSKPKKKRGKK